MDKSNEELMMERLYAANQALLDGYAGLDRSDPEYSTKLLNLTKAHEAIIKDLESCNNDKNKERELEIEDDRNRIESAKLEESTRSNRWGHGLEISKQGVLVGTTLFSGLLGWKMYKRSTRKESDEAILTQTDQTVVKSGLGNIFKGIGGNKLF